MLKTLTLKNIPEAVYERLKASAQMHRRSLNSEAIVCLESVYCRPDRHRPIAWPARARCERRTSRRAAAGRGLARALRAALPDGEFHARDIDATKRSGRP